VCRDETDQVTVAAAPLWASRCVSRASGFDRTTPCRDIRGSARFRRLPSKTALRGRDRGRTRVEFSGDSADLGQRLGRWRVRETRAGRSEHRPAFPWHYCAPSRARRRSVRRRIMRCLQRCYVPPLRSQDLPPSPGYDSIIIRSIPRANRHPSRMRPSDLPPLWRDDRGSARSLHAAGSKGDPLPQLQRVGMLETPVLQAFRWRPPEIVAKTVDEESSRFNKPQHPIFVSC